MSMFKESNLEEIIRTVFQEVESKNLFDFLRTKKPSLQAKQNDAQKLKNLLRQYLNGNISENTTEKSISSSSANVLLVFLWNDDKELVKELMDKRIVKMMASGGLREVFLVFETLILKPDEVFNVVLKCGSLPEIKELIENIYREWIQKDYGVLKAIGYKELFGFCLTITLKFIEDMIAKKKEDMTIDELLKNYSAFREEIILSIESEFKVKGFDITDLNSATHKYCSLYKCLETLKRKTYELYKKQRTWIENRFFVNKNIQENGIVFNIQRKHLDKKTFYNDISAKVLQKIKDIQRGVRGEGISKSFLSNVKSVKDGKRQKIETKLTKKINKIKRNNELKFKNEDADDEEEYNCKLCDKIITGKNNYLRHLKAKKHRKRLFKLKSDTKI